MAEQTWYNTNCALWCAQDLAISDEIGYGDTEEEAIEALHDLNDYHGYTT